MTDKLRQDPVVKESLTGAEQQGPDHFPDANKMATYGEEEVRKLRETIASMARIISDYESQQPPPFWPVVEGLLAEYGLQLIDFVGAYHNAINNTELQQEPLTDDEIALIVAECAASAHRSDDFNFSRAIERAHGIK